MDKSLNFAIFLRLISEGIRFGIVGIIATGVHIGLFVFFIEILVITPVWANIFAYTFAFIVGFIGHFLWTFKLHTRKQYRAWKPALLKFMVVSLFGLLLNTASVFIVVNILNLHYLYAVLVMVTAIPAIVFLLSKLWVYA